LGGRGSAASVEKTEECATGVKEAISLFFFCGSGIYFCENIHRRRR
jgi:hypothetical protein